MTKKIILCLVVLAGMSLTACNKTTDSGTTNKDLLIAATWKLTAATSSPGITNGGSTVTDLYASSAFFPACEKDNTSKFTSDGNLTDDEGATKCSASDPQTSVSTWTLASDTLLTVVDDGDSEVFTIQTLSATTLKMWTTLEVSGSHKVTYTFTAQ